MNLKRRRAREAVSPPPLRRSSEAAILAGSAKDKIVELIERVKQNEDGAAVQLQSAVAFAVEMLTRLCKTQPEVFEPIASHKSNWPIMLSLHPEIMRGQTEFLRGLKLGEATNINFASGKTFSWKTPANAIALRLHDLGRNLQLAPIDSWVPSQLSSLGRSGVGRARPNFHKFDADYERTLAELEAWGQTGTGSKLPPLS